MGRNTGEGFLTYVRGVHLFPKFHFPILLLFQVLQHPTFFSFCLRLPYCGGLFGGVGLLELDLLSQLV